MQNCHRAPRPPTRPPCVEDPDPGAYAEDPDPGAPENIYTRSPHTNGPRRSFSGH